MREVNKLLIVSIAIAIPITAPTDAKIKMSSASLYDSSKVEEALSSFPVHRVRNDIHRV